jgi:fluoride exporter
VTPSDSPDAEGERRRAEQASVDPELLARSQRHPAILAAIAVGGVAGTAARYGMSRLIHVTPGSFPWATFTINITGSFVLGVLLTLIIERWPPSQYVRPFVTIGFLGAYTTFSTYMVETDVLVKDHHADIAVAYVVASLVVGLIAVYAGIVVARLGSRDGDELRIGGS